MKKIAVITTCAFFALTGTVGATSCTGTCTSRFRPVINNYNTTIIHDHDQSAQAIKGLAIFAVVVAIVVLVADDAPEHIESRQEREYREWRTINKGY